MELAIPLLALGGMYVISNQSKPSNNSYKFKDDSKPGNLRENYTNMGKQSNYLPNTNIPPQNYPVSNTNELNDTVHKYVNPNVATDKYFNKNIY